MRVQTDRSVLRPKSLTSGLKPLVKVRCEQLRKHFVQSSGDPMDRCPDRWIVDNTTEVRHLQLLQPVRQHQCLVTRELDRDLAIPHCTPLRLDPTPDHTNLLTFDLAQTQRGTPRPGRPTNAQQHRKPVASTAAITMAVDISPAAGRAVRAVTARVRPSGPATSTRNPPCAGRPDTHPAGQGQAAAQGRPPAIPTPTAPPPGGPHPHHP